MQYVVIAQDYPDALERRLACREKHIQSIDEMKEQGYFLYAGATLNEAGEMNGSVMICEFPSREALDEQWLKLEPYIINRVWETIEIKPFRVGPSFL